MTLTELLELLSDDREVVEILLAAGMLPEPLDRTYDDKEAELARLARVMIRDLEVNPAGVQVILGMHHQILSLRRQMVSVLSEIHPQTLEDRGV